MTYSSTQELLSELNKKHLKSYKYAIFSLAVTIVLSIYLYHNFSNNYLLLFLFVATMIIYFSYRQDVINKTTTLFYDLEPEVQRAYSKFLDSVNNIADCSEIWSIKESHITSNKKYFAGASSIVNRKKTYFCNKEYKFIKANINIISLTAESQTLYFLPDRILVYDKNEVRSIIYNDLQIKVSKVEYREDNEVPYDSEIINHTYQFVNKDGSQDLRFKNNRILPICLYEEIKLTTATGLNKIIYLSRCGLGDNMRIAIYSLARALLKTNRT